jgi:hypothetical protein
MLVEAKVAVRRDGPFAEAARPSKRWSDIRGRLPNVR